MRFNSKNAVYYSKKGVQGRFDNPYVVSTVSIINPLDEFLEVTFELRFEQEGNTKTLDTYKLRFNGLHIDTLIEDENGEPVEILEFINGGGTYDENKILQWGTPSYTSVQGYFDLSSVWSDLTFLITPFEQLAIDWVRNNVIIEGRLLKEHFELYVAP